MSKKQITAYICDRCKRMWRSSDKPEMEKVKQKDGCVCGMEIWHEYDLCPDCLKAFNEFMKGVIS